MDLKANMFSVTMTFLGKGQEYLTNWWLYSGHRTSKIQVKKKKNHKNHNQPQ